VTFIDIKVYGRQRKYPHLPDYERNPDMTHILYRNVPVFVVTVQEMDAALLLEDVDVIRSHNRIPLLVLTDRRRVLAVDPQGYDYARYVCTIDAETARIILSKV
jgi:hypothetical protein